ncbi:MULTISPECIES: cytochrome c3 family protein [unclassified Pseudodesulfovibrio]|uniref:cytochrome c3 family protein n=1 Tax=unclassified Pseudodesulfovibrio TaxID=2661612 RepID=UPI000FEB7BE1|nr:MULTISPECIES: cytochrome c3 family protein [unclassified Pseudodesulfovibrio]MCJ2166161.1 cytochrome c3 family protein [Pseudodesulfovibrio sp. S3-i]RWU02393.1 cytochrome C [Pseudodesulfovibrio sp. S3]
MKKSLIISLMVAALVCVFALPAVIAGTAPADVITMEVPAGAEATKSAVSFPHKKHVDGGLDCLVCHHKSTSKDDVKGCAVEGCHADASKAAKKDPKGFYAAFHSKASDASCLACHKTNKKAGKAVPVACKECHK